MQEQQKLPTTVRDVILGAIKNLETKGWIRGQLRSQDGFCLDGALHYSAFGRSYGQAVLQGLCTSSTALSRQADLYHEAFRLTQEHVLEAKDSPGLVGWNDNQCSGKDEAIEVLRGTLDKKL